MPLLHSKAEAALLEAGALSHRLAERYDLAAEQLEAAADSSAAEHPLQQRFADFSEVLARQAKRLDQAARKLELLPRESETELETLKQLADQIQSLLDDQRGAALAARFGAEEDCLLEELQQAAELNPCPAAVTDGIEAGRKRIAALTESEWSGSSGRKSSRLR